MTRLGLIVSFSLLYAVGSGCAAAIRIGLDEPTRPTDPATAKVLAVMPGTVDPGSEWIRPQSQQLLVDELTSRYPDVRIVRPDEAANRLAAQSLAEEYADILGDFDLAGVVDPDRIDALMKAVGATHILHLRAGFGSADVERTTLNLDGSPLFYSSTSQHLYAVARLWESGQSTPSWEASFHVKSERGPFSFTRKKEELGEALVVSIAENIPLSGARTVIGH